MSKIIIDNQSKVNDLTAVILVKSVMDDGFVSGENQYRWVTRFSMKRVRVTARKTRGSTYSFLVDDV